MRFLIIGTLLLSSCSIFSDLDAQVEENKRRHEESKMKVEYKKSCNINGCY